MISHRHADLADRLKPPLPKGEVDMHFQSNYDYIDTIQAPKWKHSNNLFITQVTMVLEDMGFGINSYGGFRRQFTRGAMSDRAFTEYLNGFFDQFKRNFEHLNYFVALMTDPATPEGQYDIQIRLSKGNVTASSSISFRKSDLINSINRDRTVELVFEKGYMLHEGRGSDTWQYDCKNGMAIDAGAVPPIRVTIIPDGSVNATEQTRLYNQLEFWGLDPIEIDYNRNGDPDHVYIKVRKK